MFVYAYALNQGWDTVKSDTAFIFDCKLEFARLALFFHIIPRKCGRLNRM